jgi:hypothetical protein
MTGDGFAPLFTGTLDGWRQAGRGTFRVVDGAIETDGGPGLLWYAREAFADFVLEVEWRVRTPDDNSGVFVRVPPLGGGDPEHDWRPAVTDGYEIQIDERGYDPERQATASPLHATGAVYRLAPAAAGLSRPVGDWNEFRIEARGHAVTVRLNGRLASRLDGDRGRRLEGHVALQAHHAGSRAQFRAVRVMRLAAGARRP